MIGRIAEIGRADGIAAFADAASGYRRPRRRPRRAAPRDGVTIDWEAAEIGAGDEEPLDFALPRGTGDTPSSAELVAMLARYPRVAVAVQARIGRAAALRLIAVNAMHGV